MDKKLLTFVKPTRLIEFVPTDEIQSPVSKLGGIPWWPIGVPRPFCRFSHPMTFILQILLTDVPDFASQNKQLLSFHYCHSCLRTGRMSFGWSDQIHRGYDLRIFSLSHLQFADGVKNPSLVSIPTFKMNLSDQTEVCYSSDLPVRLQRRYQGIIAYRGNNFDGIVDRNKLPHFGCSKLGGWPSWIQNPQWPLESYNGTKMCFVSQIDDLRPLIESPWEGGGCGYFFATSPICSTPFGEFVLQTT